MLWVDQNDPIILPSQTCILESADLMEYGLLENVMSLVAKRSRSSRDHDMDHEDDGLYDEQRPEFRPEKRKYTVLDRWSGLKPM